MVDNKSFTITIKQPSQEQLRGILPQLARLQDDLEALGAKVNLRVESVTIEVVRDDETTDAVADEGDLSDKR